MRESDITERLRLRSPNNLKELVMGIGDDAAIYRPAGAAEDLVFTTDLVVEGTHFRADHSPEFIGEKALARGLSDIAAMGAAPRFCLVSLVLSRACDKTFVDRFYDGLLALADRTLTALAGGDLSSGPLVTCDIVVCGTVPPGSALRRSTAKAGDVVWVSGPLGRAASRNYEDMPNPKLSLGLALRDFATSCMDLSDGLSTDLQRLCEASGLAAEVDSVPAFSGATLEQALHGGEDYELLFTTSAPVALPGCHAIGKLSPGTPGAVSFRGQPLSPGGFDHLVSWT